MRFGTGALMLTALACAVALTVSGCASLSHVNDPDAFGIYFRNDLSQPVVLALCASKRSVNCGHAYYRDRVAVGESMGENISPDVATEWAVETTDGRLLRCVYLYWKYWPGHDESLRVSAAPKWATPCPRRTPVVPHGA